jgi:hypothetical protein
MDDWTLRTSATLAAVPSTATPTPYKPSPGSAPLPTALYATRLMFGWEHADLMTALEMPGDPFPTALVTVEATFSSHTLRWHPLDITWGLRGSVGAPTVVL